VDVIFCFLAPGALPPVLFFLPETVVLRMESAVSHRSIFTLPPKLILHLYIVSHVLTRSIVPRYSCSCASKGKEAGEKTDDD